MGKVAFTDVIGCKVLEKLGPWGYGLSTVVTMFMCK